MEVPLVEKRTKVLEKFLKKVELCRLERIEGSVVDICEVASQLNLSDGGHRQGKWKASVHLVWSFNHSTIVKTRKNPKISLLSLKKCNNLANYMPADYLRCNH
jgi:hypothetical protein